MNQEPDYCWRCGALSGLPHKDTCPIVTCLTQERKEDGPQPRGPSSPATQRNNHGEVA